MRYLFLGLCVSLCGVGSAVAADKVRSSWDTDISAEYRYFLHEPIALAQEDDSLSLAISTRHVKSWRRGREKVVLQPFYRHDFADSQRTHFDMREFYYLEAHRDYEVSVGVRKIFWGVAESQHLVDIINQTDAVENLDGEDKLGQPMLQFSYITKDYGTFGLYALTGFRERTFAGRDGRLRLIPSVDKDEVDYEDSARYLRIDAAFRWSLSVGDWDIGLSHFSGTSREPNFRVQLSDEAQQVVDGLPPGAVDDLADLADNLPDGFFDNLPSVVNDFVPASFFTVDPNAPFAQRNIAVEAADNFATLVPVYQVIDQTGLDINGVVGSWLLKLEAITRSGQGELRSNNPLNLRYDTSKRYYAAVGGVEYTLYQIFDTDADLGLIVEYSYDSRGENAISLFEDDVFVGGRLAFNDAESSTLLFGVFYDNDDHEQFYSLEASRRLASNISLNIEGRWFSNVQPNNYPLNILDHDDYVQAELVFYY